MAVSYNGLWKILIDKNLQRKDLTEELNISSATIAKMGKGEQVS
ncbi:MAG: helix-turn-helix domain-containing protein, partial [Clostridiales bacterium]|nr:helix-turn-helix domain-containing protein [Clostridiales bacterium]